MAIIDGQVPQPAPQPANVARRVVVKLRGDVDATVGVTGPEIARRVGGAWETLAGQFPGVRIAPYFTGLDGASLRRAADKARTAGVPASAVRFTSYVAIEVPNADSLEAVARTVNEWTGVEIAYPEGGPTPPPVAPDNDPRSANQGYLNAAPDGIDARWVWANNIADGAGVGFVDLERGWTLAHEDLSAASITIISGLSQDYHGHGTAVLGEVVGVDNAIGVVGIAPVASARVVSQWRTATSYNTAEAILSAVDHMNAGDVLLLEAQTSYPGAAGYVPVEVEEAVFDAIVAATAQGIVVVEAGANGSVDLDAFTDVNGRQILNRSSGDFRDSGAIMVGAGSAGAPHTRLSFSNFGTRIDCYAWGGQIETSGDGWTGTSTTAYTSSFGGTSGASPIVTGAALLLQSWRISRSQPPYSPHSIRQLLRNPAVNTASADPAADRIGVMPNLRGIVEHEQFVDVFKGRRWWAVVYILFGVIQDGGGIVFKPGVGPIPIDPWGPLEHLAPEKRDVLAGLALTELADLFADSATRKDVSRAGVTAIKRAVEGMGKNQG